ncbi:MAG TPA: hydrogenase maturation protease [Verrucomicrobiae bacterium]|nr:hydrogenase maturation protease [Verrucomicrobiae bacterium]
MPRILIVAYGNPLRSDDGLASRAAGLLERKFPSADVEILRLHQLTPELAETLRHAEAVIFVDAAARGAGAAGDLRCAEISAPSQISASTHHLIPEAVLGLSQQLYKATPRAFSVTLVGESFDHGESLSPRISAALPQLVAQIEEVVQQLLKADPSSSHR